MLFGDMLSPLTPNDLRRIFEKLDKNGDGFVSLDNLNKLLERIGNFEVGAEEVESLVGKKGLDFNEFLSFYESISSNHKSSSSCCSSSGGRESKRDEEEEDDDDENEDVQIERDLVKAFKVFDMDGDGFISSQELECVLKRLDLWEKSGKDCRSMICAYDTNLDGQLDFQEFKNMMLLTIP